MARIALIVVTYNSMKFLPELLLSLHGMKEPDGGVSYIFVDNASSDGTADYIAENFPRSIILRERSNLGFSAANNHGIQHCVARDAEFIALLNPDTAVTEDWFIKILPVFDKDRTIASAQPLLLYGQDKEKINSAGNKIHFLGFGFTDGNGEPLSVISTGAKRNGEIPSLNKKGSLDLARDDREENIRTVTYASGAAVVYRKKYLEEIGFFDEDLFMYHDDLDVGWKFLLRGYCNVLVPSAIVYHHYEFSRSIKKYYWMERNRLMILLTHYRYRTLILLLPAFIVLEIGLTFFSLIRGFFIARLKAYGWIICRVPTLIRKHRRIQTLRRVGDGVLLKQFTGIISHQEISNPIVDYIMNPVFFWYFVLLKYVIRW